MRPSTAEHSHLAVAYLALADGPEPSPSQRSARRTLCALATGIVLARAAPRAGAAPGPPGALPAATPGAHAGVVADDDDDDVGA